MEALRNKDGTLKKGVVLNPKGRGQGTPNRTTAELKAAIKLFVDAELENVQDLLSELTPKERLDVLCKLIPYVLPKQTELVTDNSKEIIISFKED